MLTDRAALERRLSSVLDMLYVRGLLDIQVRYQMGSKKKKKYKPGFQGRGLGW